MKSQTSADKDAWTLYWQSNTLNSCVATASDADRKQIEEVWKQLARNSRDGFSVLDLATGNGTVAVAMLSVRPELEITGVDRADIDPTTYVASNPLLNDIEFIGNTDVEALPFDENSFDLITSQFGIEYANLERALIEAIRVLAPEGHLCFLMHHVDSDILSSISPYKIELDVLLSENGLIAEARKYVEGHSGLAQLEGSGQNYLQCAHIKTKRISGQVFETIERIIAKVDDDSTRLQIIEQLAIRLEAEKQRLVALQRSAKTAAEVDELAKILRNSDFSNVTVEPFFVGDDRSASALVAWLLRAQKNAEMR